MVNGGRLSSKWCKQSESFKVDLISPRSYEILGRVKKDNYFRGKYRNSYKVRVHSSNSGGSPIVHTWDVNMHYEELLYLPGEVGWCIATFSR